MILVLIFHIFSFLSRAFAIMAKSYTSQSYMNGNRDCNTFIPWSNMANYLIFIIMNIKENLKIRGK